ncbi:panoramix [Musca autumnalis]|uniref:panoramix n=1 Tax=Musca autumnalis TaxID=221902 RepID=UPI003CF6F6F3
MSEEIPIKAEPEEDEENGRVTPVRKSVLEYEQSLNSCLSNNSSSHGIAVPADIDTTQVIVKNEPQDIADLEKTMARFDGATNNERVDDEDDRATPPPPPAISSEITTPSEIAHILSEPDNVAVKQEPQADKEESPIDTTNAEVANPDPPPTPSRISVISAPRLRVKAEFSAPLQEETSHEITALPQDFFDGILNEEDVLARPLIEPKRETIPSDFFDDLLVDKVQERIEAAETQDLEIKYGDRLRKLQELERKLEKEKKKHKKSKKKSRKRGRSPSHSPRKRGSRSPSPRRKRSSNSRSPSRRRRSPSPPRRRSPSPSRRRSPSPSRRRSPSPSRRRSPCPSRRRSPSPSRRRSPSPSRRRHASRSPSPNEKHGRKIMRWPKISEMEDRIEMANTSARVQEHLAETKRKIKIEDEIPTRTSPEDVEYNEDELCENMQPHLPELGGEITAKQKRDRVIVRAKTLLKYLKVSEMEKEKPLSTFLYTSIVRKLPTSHSFRNQHIYENRSPLHNVNNVSYKFNSHIRRFNLEEWGLASLPPIAANVAKLVGYNAEAIHNQLKVVKIPAKIRKIKGEPVDEDDEEELLKSGSSLFCNACTQTDVVDSVIRTSQSFDIGVQAVPQAFEIACQTLETESPSVRLYDNSDDLPIMGIMREMNDSQLMALHDFAELLKETVTNSMDMYRLRQRMLDIYKSAQQPSALAPSSTSAADVNSYSSHDSSPSSRIRQSDNTSGLRINSVAGGDGSYFSVNDPRNNFIGSRNRHASGNQVPRNNRPFDNRNVPRGTESHRDLNNSQQRTQQSSNGPKFYGRGGLRR